MGDLTQKVDPLGRIIQYGYDADNRETSEQWLPVGGGTAFYTMTITYDPAGRVSEIQDDNSDYTYTYDDAGRVTSVDNSGTPGAPSVTLDLRLRRRRQPHQPDRQPGRGGQLHLRRAEPTDPGNPVGHGRGVRARGFRLRCRRQPHQPHALQRPGRHQRRRRDRLYV